jgi:hypothetical protein
MVRRLLLCGDLFLLNLECQPDALPPVLRLLLLAVLPLLRRFLFQVV